MNANRSGFFSFSAETLRLRGIFLAALFLFVLMPLSLVLGLFDWVVTQERNVQNQQVFLQSQRFLEKVSRWTEIQSQLRNRFKMLAKEAFLERIQPAQWPVIMARLRKKWGITADVYHFDELGKLLTPTILQVRQPELFSQFRSALFFPYDNQMKSHQRLLDSLFGSAWSFFSFSPNTAMPFRGAGSDGCFFWVGNPLTREGGIVFVTWETPQPLQLVRARLGIASLSPDLTMFAKEQNGGFISLHGNLDRRSQELVSQMLKDAGQPVWSLAGKTWVRLPIKDFTFYLGLPERALWLEQHQQGISWFFFFLGLIGLGACYRWSIQGHDRYLSIRFKLVFLFWYALLIPFLGIFALSYKGFRESERILVAGLREEGLEAIKTLDDGFLKEPPKIQNLFQKYYRLFSTNQSQKNFLRMKSQYLFTSSFSTLELRDGSGKPVQTAGAPAASDESMMRVMNEFFHNAIRKYLPERELLLNEKEEGSLNSFIVQSILENSDIGLDDLLEKPGQICRLTLPRFDLFFIWNYYPDLSLPAPLLMGSSAVSRMKESYLKQTLRARAALRRPDIHLFTCDLKETYWIPQSGANSPALRSLAQQVRLTGEQQTRRVTWRGKPYLAVGSSGKQLSEHLLFALLPLDPVNLALQSLQRQILFGILAALLLTWFLGRALTRTFLAPIVELGHGIDALRAKDSRFRLPELARDEFGDLSRTFNEMMENLEELNAGRLVQAELFPQTPLAQGEYRVFGISRPATDLGGDYFDYLSIDEHQFLVLMGDVTGHGIPAALIMAMSKAIVATFPLVGSTPGPLLEKLNRALHSVMKGKRLMTLSMFWINSTTHEATYHHFGHPFPLRWRQTGSTEFLKGIGAPIGSGSAIRSKPVSLSLAKGERIVLYTDGLVESFSTDTNADGFLLFEQYLRQQPWAGLTEACASILQDHPFFKRDEPQPDDFTVVIIERTAVEPTVL